MPSATDCTPWVVVPEFLKTNERRTLALRLILKFITNFTQLVWPLLVSQKNESVSDEAINPLFYFSFISSLWAVYQRWATLFTDTPEHKEQLHSILVGLLDIKKQETHGNGENTATELTDPLLMSSNTQQVTAAPLPNSGRSLSCCQQFLQRPLGMAQTAFNLSFTKRANQFFYFTGTVLSLIALKEKIIKMSWSYSLSSMFTNLIVYVSIFLLAGNNAVIYYKNRIQQSTNGCIELKKWVEKQDQNTLFIGLACFLTTTNTLIWLINSYFATDELNIEMFKLLPDTLSNYKIQLPSNQLSSKNIGMIILGLLSLPASILLTLASTAPTITFLFNSTKRNRTIKMFTKKSCRYQVGYIFFKLIDSTSTAIMLFYSGKNELSPNSALYFIPAIILTQVTQIFWEISVIFSNTTVTQFAKNLKNIAGRTDFKVTKRTFYYEIDLKNGDTPIKLSTKQPIKELVDALSRWAKTDCEAGSSAPNYQAPTGYQPVSSSGTHETFNPLNNDPLNAATP